MASEEMRYLLDQNRDRVLDQWKKINRLENPEDRLEEARRLDRQNNFGPKLAAALSFELAKGFENPTVNWIIQKATNEKIRNKNGQREDARMEMRDSANLDFTLDSKPPLFPDIPKIHPSLRHHQYYISRLNVANGSAKHPRYGIPDNFNSDPVKILSRDVSLSLSLYRHNNPFQDSLKPGTGDPEIVRIFEQSLRSEIPPANTRQKGFLRFWGQRNENSFRAVLETDLYWSMAVKLFNANRDSLKEMMVNPALFAIEADQFRPAGNHERKTGESYYCHYLTAAWLLWKMYEDDVDLNTGWDLVEDMQVMFLHDLFEDLKGELEIQAEDKSKTNWIITIKKTGSKLKINNAQRVILEAMTKKDEEGEGWFDNIMNIQDAQFPGLNDKLKLLRRVARCKSADRMANLPTMTAAGGEYIETVRKLNETIDAGAPLQWWGHMADKGPLETMLYLSNLDHTAFLRKFGIITLLADMEKKIILSRFGRTFLRNVIENKSAWSREMKSVLKKEYKEAHQFWSRRFRELKKCYDLPDWYFFIPDIHLSNYFGLGHFAETNQYPSDKTPDIKMFDAELAALSIFQKNMTPLRGPIVGGPENVWGSAHYRLEDIPNTEYVGEINQMYARNEKLTNLNIHRVETSDIPDGKVIFNRPNILSHLRDNYFSKN